MSCQLYLTNVVYSWGTIPDLSLAHPIYFYTFPPWCVCARTRTHSAIQRPCIHPWARKFRSKRNSLLNSNLALLAFLPSFSGMALDLTKSPLKIPSNRKCRPLLFLLQNVELRVRVRKKKRYWPLIVNLICLTHMQLQIKSVFVQCLGSWGLVGINNK